MQTNSLLHQSYKWYDEHRRSKIGAAQQVFKRLLAPLHAFDIRCTIRWQAAAL